MNIFAARRVGEDWDEIRTELQRMFELSRQAALSGQSFVYVVRNDDLLGRGGAGDAMVATGLLSSARTAALEGAREGWTANVIAHDDDVPPDQVRRWAETMLDSQQVTGELIRLGTGHIGKALP